MYTKRLFYSNFMYEITHFTESVNLRPQIEIIGTLFYTQTSRRSLGWILGDLPIEANQHKKQLRFTCSTVNILRSYYNLSLFNTRKQTIVIFRNIFSSIYSDIFIGTKYGSKYN